jgi:hypothetical protein
MKRFLVQLARFATFFSLFSVSVILILFIIIKNSTTHRNLANSKYEVVVVGNSMPQTSIDDALLPKTLNCAGAGNYTLISFFKLRTILSHIPSVKVVFLTFGPWVEDESEIKRASFIPGLDVVVPDLSLEEFIKLDVSYYAKLKAIQGAWRNLLKSSNELKRPFLNSGYLPNERSRLDVDINRRGMYIYAKTFKPSQYYHEIETLCKQKNIKIIFLETPIYHRDHYFPDVDIIRQRYFPDVEFWRFDTCNLPESCYGDITHLNAQGAKVFTPIFCERLNKLQSER